MMTLAGWMRNLAEYIELPSVVASTDDKLRLIENFAEWWAEHTFEERAGDWGYSLCEDCDERRGDGEPRYNEGYE